MHVQLVIVRKVLRNVVNDGDVARAANNTVDTKQLVVNLEMLSACTLVSIATDFPDEIIVPACAPEVFAKLEAVPCDAGPAMGVLCLRCGRVAFPERVLPVRSETT